MSMKILKHLYLFSLFNGAAIEFNRTLVCTTYLESKGVKDSSQLFRRNWTQQLPTTKYRREEDKRAHPSFVTRLKCIVLFK